LNLQDFVTYSNFCGESMVAALLICASWNWAEAESSDH